MKKITVFITLSIVGLVIWLSKDMLSPKVENLQLTDIIGKPHKLFNDAPVLVNFWATDCVACIKEMPHLNALHQQYQDQGFRVIAIAMSYDKLEAIKLFNKQKQLTFPVIYDQLGEIVAYFGKVKVTPTSFLLDSKGHILKKVIGEPNWQEWQATIEQQL